MEKQQTQEDVSRLISGSMRPYDERHGIARTDDERRVSGGRAPNPHLEKLRRLMNPELVLNVICVLLALGFLALAASNFTMSGNFLTIDSLFLTAVSLMLAGIFLVNPALTAYEKGLLKNPFADTGDVPVIEEGPIHFEGSTKLFLAVLGALLFMTLIEVLLAYFEVSLVIMLIILMGLSLIKAALIVAYFMHLRFERRSLVLTLIPILVVCICLLFIFFPDSMRSRRLRATPAAAHATATAPAGAPTATETSH
ncbi:MAG TPA: cytochrome C oxidase subunit IV family protein [Pyrinomonadaceae bacterium]|jgi:cytochrome c oxidase subunit 4